MDERAAALGAGCIVGGCERRAEAVPARDGYARGGGSGVWAQLFSAVGVVALLSVVRGVVMFQSWRTAA